MHTTCESITMRAYAQSERTERSVYSARGTHLVVRWISIVPGWPTTIQTHLRATVRWPSRSSTCTHTLAAMHNAAEEDCAECGVVAPRTQQSPVVSGDRPAWQRRPGTAAAGPYPCLRPQ